MFRVIAETLNRHLFTRCGSHYLAPLPRGLRELAPLDCSRISLRIAPTYTSRGLAVQLLHRTLVRALVRAPADEAGAVSNTVAGDVVEGHLDDEFVLQFFVLACPVG